MKRFNFFAFCLISILVQVSCGETNKTEQRKLEFPISLNLASLFDGEIANPLPPLSEIVDSIEYIHLSNANGNPIGNISEIKVTENFIFVNASSEAALMFDRRGTFIRQIGAIGKGPGEYSQPLGIIPFEEDNVVAIYAYPLGDYMIYNLNGQFIKRLPRFSGRNPLPLNKDIVIGDAAGFFNRKWGFMVRAFNLNGDTVIDKRSHHEPLLNADAWRKLQYITNTTLVPYNSDTLLAYELAIDTLFSFDGKALSPRYILNLEGYGGNLLDRLSLVTEAIANRTTSLLSFFETTKYFFAVFVVSSRPWLVSFNKSTQELCGAPYPLCFPENVSIKLASTENVTIENDVDGGPDIYPKQIMSSRIGVSWFYPYELKDLDNPMQKHAKNPLAQAQLSSMINRIDIEGNPVVAILYFK